MRGGKDIPRHHDQAGGGSRGARRTMTRKIGSFGATRRQTKSGKGKGTETRKKGRVEHHEENQALPSLGWRKKGKTKKTKMTSHGRCGRAILRSKRSQKGKRVI